MLSEPLLNDGVSRISIDREKQLNSLLERLVTMTCSVPTMIAPCTYVAIAEESQDPIAVYGVSYLCTMSEIAEEVGPLWG